MTIVKLLFLILLSPTLWSQSYTLKDLEVLAQEGSFEEFLDHALDVRPSDRQEAWKSMVSSQAQAYAQSVLVRSEIKAEDFAKIERLFTWTSLKSDDVFKLRRQEIGLKFLRKCLRAESPCFDELKAYWEADQTDPEVAVKLAEMLKEIPNSPVATWTFLDVALKSSLSEFYCKKDFVMDALWEKVGIDYIRLGTKGDLTLKIDQTIHPDCLPALIQTARTKLLRPKKETDRELGFQILKSQNKADVALTDFFYTVYLLEKPSQGELFNYSWGRLKELGSAPLRRERVLDQLKRLDPLPDDLFGSMDQTKKRVVLTHFKENFPEYLKLYTDQCTLFYGGKGSFPEGNPTLHCQEFMSSDLAPKIFDQYQIKNYLDVKKI